MSNRHLLIHFGKTLILIGAVTGTYFLLGLLGLLFRVPSGSIGMIMPSAGLALAATLLLGIRILPAVAIGNFCVSAWFFNFNQEYLYFYSASAIGSALSAWIGCCFVRSLIGFPDPLVESRKILLFLCIAGPLSSLLSAVVSVTAMHNVGIIALKGMPLACLGWWFADILGILIFTPPILIMFAEPHHIWYRRRATVGLPIILTFTLVVILSFYLKGIARKQYTEQLKEEAVTFSQKLTDRIQLDLSSLYGIRNFLLGSQPIEPNEFSSLTRQMLLPLKEMRSISWVSLSEAKPEKSQFISVHDELTKNKPETLQAIPSGIKEKLLASPSSLKTEYLVSEQNSFKLFIPVVKELSNDKKTLSVIIATVSLETLAQQALDRLNTNHCEITISTFQNAVSGAKNIYTNLGDSVHSLYEAIPIQAADQTWLISFYHDWSRKPDIYWPIGSIIFSGFWFTGILGIVLLYLTGRNFRTEAIIDEHTKALTETKIAAEQANQAKNQFLAKISHELRTPLNGISGFTQLLEKKPSLNAEDKKQVAIIKQCSDDLLRLINDILDISAIETQQIKLDISEFNFTLLLTDSIRICKFRADEKGIKLVTKNSCSPRKYLGDEKRIRQILVNLIDNAVKYTSHGSVTVSSSYQDGMMKISVSDTGFGIAHEDLDRIFTPFVQVNVDSFTREGVGLGLSITKELVHLMDGDLTVSSEIGKGSTFTVLLPLPVGEENQLQVVLPDMLDEAAKFNGTYVLVVDDSEINLLFLVSMLEQLRCKVDSAVNGQEALALFEQNQYDFALIDINMPILNGIDLVKRLRDQHFKLKLVAVSAYADDAKINEALSAGFDAYITKPIEEYQLVELIQASKM